jgi:hypothetical protein
MAESAFGVEHTISKAYRKLGPKVYSAGNDIVARLGPDAGMNDKTQSMDTRMRTNYLTRKNAGDASRLIHQMKGSPHPRAAGMAQDAIKNARGHKAFSNASISAVNNMNRRKPGTGIGRMEASAAQKLAPTAKKTGVLRRLARIARVA